MDFSEFDTPPSTVPIPGHEKDETKPPFLGSTAGSDDLTCQVCGKPLTYGGRGPKPKFCDEHKRGGGSTARPTRSNARAADVERACDSLDQLYAVMALPLALVSPRAAGVWADQTEGLSQRNRMLLPNNRKLVDMINKGADKGGTVAFIASHGLAVAPVLVALRMDVNARYGEPPVADENVYTGDFTGTGPVDPTADPDAAFRS